MTAPPIRITSVVGARPQFIKAAVVARALAGKNGVVHRLIHTGQHYDADMSDVFFRELDIPTPDHDLGVGSASHGAQTAEMLRLIEGVLQAGKPEWLVVYGDTNSTLAGALAAAKLHVPIAHVEAGLRSFNRRMPEELNRVLADHASDLLFAPTDTAVENLAREGISGARVALIGDVMYDAARFYGPRVGGRRADLLAANGVEAGGYVLATVHRAENTDDRNRLRAIFEGLGRLSEELPVLVPLHPRTARALEQAGIDTATQPRCRLLPPLGYLDMLALESGARIIATDSGGVQKEAFFQRVPCVTLRDETEWVELVRFGWNRLLPPTDADAVEAGLRAALSAPRPAEPAGAPYGGGAAGERIVARLLGG